MTMQVRLRWTRFLLLILAVMIALSVVYPVAFNTYPEAVSAPLISEKSMPAQVKDDLIEMDDFIKALIGGLFIIVGWFFIRTISKVDRNQTAIFEKLDGLCRDFDRLKAEHDVIKERCHRE